MNVKLKHQPEPFITPCLVLFDFNQVFLKSLKFFAQTLQIHIISHTEKPCAGANSSESLGPIFFLFVLGVLEGLNSRGLF